MSDNSKNPVTPSNMIKGKKYFKSNDKGGFIYLGVFTKTYEYYHYDGPSRASGTEHGYIFSNDNEEIKVRDDYSKMTFYEDK